jgi:hypothetical protein
MNKEYGLCLKEDGKKIIKILLMIVGKEIIKN